MQALGLEERSADRWCWNPGLWTVPAHRGGTASAGGVALGSLILRAQAERG